MAYRVEEGEEVKRSEFSGEEQERLKEGTGVEGSWKGATTSKDFTVHSRLVC